MSYPDSLAQVIHDFLVSTVVSTHNLHNIHYIHYTHYIIVCIVYIVCIVDVGATQTVTLVLVVGNIVASILWFTCK